MEVNVYRPDANGGPQIFWRSFNLHRGHRLYALEVKTLQFDEVTAKHIKLGKGKVLRRDLLTQDGYIYCSALNPANAEKKFMKMLQDLTHAAQTTV